MINLDASACGARTDSCAGYGPRAFAVGFLPSGAASLTTSEGTGATAFRGSMGKNIGKVRFTIDDPRIEPCPTTGCWLWLGCINESGYGQCASLTQRSAKAHRASWETNRGPIPEGMFLDHICRVRSCVNPDHLRIVTPKINALENSVSPSAFNAQKSCCPTCGSTFVYYKNNGRRCVRCHLAKARAREAGAEYLVVGSDGSERKYPSRWKARNARVLLSRENPKVKYTRKISRLEAR